jgi:F0F1-type ATP synthase assembly protein I
MNELEDIFAIVLSLSIPIVAIIGGFFIIYQKTKKESELKKALIENNTDPETVKLLITERPREKKKSLYGTFQAACILIGAGLGYLANVLLGITSEGNAFGFIILLAVGIGFGLLASFFVMRSLDKKDNKKVETE